MNLPIIFLYFEYPGNPIPDNFVMFDSVRIHGKFPREHGWAFQMGLALGMWEEEFNKVLDKEKIQAALASVEGVTKGETTFAYSGIEYKVEEWSEPLQKVDPLVTIANFFKT